MARNKEPVDLILAKGKSHHLTKKVIEERKNSEIKAPADKVEPPAFLNARQKKEFNNIAKELIDLDIISNLDCNALGMYIKAFDLYIKITKRIEKIKLDDLEAFKEFAILQDKYAKQCRMLASDLGLTITSRCRLVIPKAPEPKKNKFDKFGAG